MRWLNDNYCKEKSIEKLMEVYACQLLTDKPNLKGVEEFVEAVQGHLSFVRDIGQCKRWTVRDSFGSAACIEVSGTCTVGFVGIASFLVRMHPTLATSVVSPG